MKKPVPRLIFLRALAVAFIAASLSGPASASPRDPSQHPPPDPHPTFKMQVVGQGRPVIFIPGLATPGDIWQPTVDHLKATCQCHVLTLTGFGHPKGIGGNGPFLSRVRDELISYVHDNHLDHPVIVGHSLGGVMALWVAETAPDLPGRLVIVDAMPFMAAIMDPAATVESARAQIAPMVEQISNASREDFASYQRLMLSQWISSPEQAKKIAAETSQSDPKTVGLAISELMSTDLRGDLGKITCPALVLCALADKVTHAPRDSVINTFHQQYDGLHGVRFEMFDHAKHFIMVDDPAGFQKSLDDELAAK